MKIFQTLAKPDIYRIDEGVSTDLKQFYENTFLPLFTKPYNDCKRYALPPKCTSVQVFEQMSSIAAEAYNEAFAFAKSLAFRTDLIPYDGPLFDYTGHLLPILSSLSRLPGFPDGPIYILVDDAHWLGETQARVLNSWVATRTSRKASFKISTQYNYKTYYTLTGATIDTPHDYSEIDISTIYTGNNKSKYRDRIADIVKKRLMTFGLDNISAEQFFPEDTEQESEIRQIGEEYKIKHDRGEAKGHYRSDDALRYARPDFIKGLAGTRKSSSTYSYAGFRQLVHLSSGIVRHLLHPAHLMYAETRSRTNKDIVTEIPPSIQDEIVRREANDFLFSDFERFNKAEYHETIPQGDIKKLSNLIQGLGGLFRQILLSDRSERRVFSIAFSDTASDVVDRILDLGVQLGYFHKSTIGRKDSMSGGRTRLYVLNRRLAPIWNLDPTGFAGYLFVTNALIEEAIEHPHSLLRRIGKDGIPDDANVIQLDIFQRENYDDQKNCPN
jgi:hypothetical protein